MIRFIRPVLPCLAASLIVLPAWACGPPVVAEYVAGAAARVSFNDNLVAAGTLRHGRLDVQLVVRPAVWHVMGEDEEPGSVLAFAERGHAPLIPGPLIRVTLGTRIDVAIENTTDSTLVVHGLSGRRQDTLDVIRVAPRSTARHSFIADAEGTYYYWATTTGAALNRRYYEDSQLGGAFVVDPPGGSPPDRVLVVGMWLDAPPLPDGAPDFAAEYTVVNGRPWPLTERFTYDVGDSIRWRVINASFDVHPLHLHGFYYRVDARGDLARDSIFWPAEQRMAVTERLMPGQTMSMVWSPDRPGGWLLHCHLTFHVAPNPGRGAAREDSVARRNTIYHGHPFHEPHNHVEKGMGGLMLATFVAPPPGWTFDEPAERELRLFVNSDSAPGMPRRFAYVLEEGSAPPPDSLRLPGSTLVLRRGEPTSIRVFNRSSEPTQIHWHGLELQSYYDGVVGIGGHPGMPTPAIMPGDSFEMRITPPRAGSFMYHTHMNDVKQQAQGLYGPIVVLEPDEVWNPLRDIVMLVGTEAGQGPILNGRTEHEPLELRVGEAYRFRLMNVTLAAPGLRMRLVRAGAPDLWTRRAKDGHDLPPHAQIAESADQIITIGETFDFLFTPRSPGDMSFEVRTVGYRMLASVPIHVRP